MARGQHVEAMRADVTAMDLMAWPNLPMFWVTLRDLQRSGSASLEGRRPGQKLAGGANPRKVVFLKQSPDGAKDECHNALS